MTDVKTLLAAATPLPWGIGANTEDPSFPYVTTPTGHGLVAEAWGGPDAHNGPADAALIVYAVNRLPDYEALREAATRLVENDCDGYGEVEAVLRRLRGEA